MPYQIEWLVAHQVISLTICGVLSLTELHQLVQDIINKLKASQAPIHLILQTENLEKFPNDIQEHYKAFRQIPREKMGWFLLVSEDSVLQYVTSTTSRLTGLRWRTYSNLADAITFLKKVDNTVDWDMICRGSS